MKKIGGVGDTQLERYGEDFIAEIKRYLDENPGLSKPSLTHFQAFKPPSR
jgi:hypothetical protein